MHLLQRSLAPSVSRSIFQCCFSPESSIVTVVVTERVASSVMASRSLLRPQRRQARLFDPHFKPSSSHSWKEPAVKKGLRTALALPTASSPRSIRRLLCMSESPGQLKPLINLFIYFGNGSSNFFCIRLGSSKNFLESFAQNNRQQTDMENKGAKNCKKIQNSMYSRLPELICTADCKDLS